jgi:hypothetical protein
MIPERRANSHRFRVGLQMTVVLVGYAIWATFAYFDPTERRAFLMFTVSTVTGTLGLVLRDMQSPSHPTKETP